MICFAHVFPINGYKSYRIPTAVTRVHGTIFLTPDSVALNEIEDTLAIALLLQTQDETGLRASHFTSKE